MAFEFKGKSGVQHKTSVHDRRLARMIKSIQELPGQRLFSMWTATEAATRWTPTTSTNTCTRSQASNFTAKDFRTWAGTLAAAKALSMHPAPQTEREAKKTVTLCVKATAGLLGNTPAVCRSAYIHPEVLRAFVDQRLPEAFAEVDGEDFEQAVLKWLDALTEEVERRKPASPEPRRSRRPSLRLERDDAAVNR